MRLFSIIALSAIWFVATSPNPLKAADQPKPTSLAQADEDFAVQGEYLGTDRDGGPIGLQVIALGNGKFDGVLYHGGLPGNGWHAGDKKTKLAGQRQDDSIVLNGDEGSIRIAGIRGKFHNSQGNPAGQFKKVRRISPTLGARAPAGANVLFDGSSGRHFKGGRLTEGGLLLAGAVTAEPVDDFRMHLEFRTPYKPHARGQGRGNSGVYIQERYEVQILDSFGLEGAFNEAGALYRTQPPDMNMCLPPLAWQTYDIYFQAARWDEQGKKTANAQITVIHNGIVVHDKFSIPNKTGAGRKEEPTARPIKLQDHGNPVVFRNIWLVPGAGEYHKPQPAPANVGRCRCRCGCR